jgi:prepilin-type N-terminal cleavage/methylation domain-containing protein
MNNKAFTLIELLVVVLIIGILASIALPKYNVAVAKSRLAAVIPIAKSIKDSAEAYYLANGSYPEDSLENLDIEISNCQSIGGGICKKGNYVFDWLSRGPTDSWYDAAGYTVDGNVLINSYHFFTDHSANPGVRYCGAAKDNETANTVCKSMGGTKVASNAYCTVSTYLNGPLCNLYQLP